MKRLLVCILTVIVICTNLFAVSADGSVAYVAPDGEVGTFATVQEAVDSGATHIVLKPGNYTEQIVIENKDGIIIRPETPGTATFDGGTAIPFSAFKKVTDEAILDRIIEKKGKEAVVSVNLKDLGITEFGNLHPNGFHPSGRDDAIEGQGFAPTLTYMDDASKTITAVKEGITIKMSIGADSFDRNNETVMLDSPATIIDSRTLVPVRAIAESFGSQVEWAAETKTVTITD